MRLLLVNLARPVTHLLQMLKLDELFPTAPAVQRRKVHRYDVGRLRPGLSTALSARYPALSG